jgi:hypothetical protein
VAPGEKKLERKKYREKGMEKQIERKMENLKRRLTGSGTMVDIDVAVLNIALTYRHCLFMLFPR